MRVTRLLSAVAVGTCFATAVAAGPALAATARSQSATVAPAPPTAVGPQNSAAKSGAKWLTGQINAQGYVPSETTPGTADLSSTVQVSLALAAANVGSTQATAALTYMEHNVDAYVSQDGTDGPGQLALLILDAHALGVDPHNFGGTNLVARLLATEQTTGTDIGLFGAQDPTYNGAYRQGLSLSALGAVGLTSGAEVTSAASWLKTQQCPDGGWSSYEAAQGCTVDPADYVGPDTNSTAQAIQGLVAVGALTGAASTLATSFLTSAQDSDGGWGYYPNTVAVPGISDPNSTAVVTQSVIALGQSPTAAPFALAGGNPVTFLQSQQLTSGADTGAFVFPVAAGGSGTANLLATYQAVPALAGLTFPFGPSGGSYWLTGADGGIFAFGAAGYYGSLPALGVSVNNITDMISSADGKGYLLVGANGGTYAFGDARFSGSLPALGVTVSNVVGLVPTADGGGYWMVGSDGGVFAFGDAGFIGSLPALGVSVSNIVGIVPTADGGGYWMVGSDGGVFAFGDAGFIGSLPALGVSVHNIVGISPSPDGGGYLLTGANGGVYAFGDATFSGSLPGLGVSVNNVVGIATTPAGNGYWMASSDGGVFNFGAAAFSGSLGSLKLASPIVAVAASQARSAG
jgi:Squalene-hopene cyclase C-terminal domain